MIERAAAGGGGQEPGGGTLRRWATFVVAGQWFAVPGDSVADVLAPRALSRVPLAPPQVAGSINWRGRIVTVLDTRACLGMAPARMPEKCMSVLVEVSNDRYAFLVDRSAEAVTIAPGDVEPTPGAVETIWRDIAGGLVRRGDRLLVMLDVARLLDFTKKQVL